MCNSVRIYIYFSIKKYVQYSIYNYYIKQFINSDIMKKENGKIVLST